MCSVFAGHKKRIRNFGRKSKGKKPLEGPVQGTTTMDAKKK